MKRTRKELELYLNETAWGASPKEMADKLIQEGFVKVEEPREFWLIRDRYNGELIAINQKEYAQALENEHPQLSKLIHVREVVEE